MTQYNVGSDHSGTGDTECINKICDILEQNGHTTLRLGVTPNLEAKLMNQPSDSIGVFLVNGLCIGTVKSLSDDLKNTTIIGIPKVMYTGSVSLPDGLKTQPLKLDPRQSTWPDSYKELNGKTFDEVCGMCENIEYVYGDTCEDVAQAILDGNFGGGGSSQTTTQAGEGSVMSGWESITDLLKPLDGEAMVVVRGDTVIIKRIYPPTSTSLWVYEGINIVDGSVNISDYSPESYNTFQINWGATFEHSFEMSFEKHKELFGERRKEVNAIYEVPYMGGEEPQTTEEGGEDANEDDGGLFGFVTDSLLNVATGGASGAIQDGINAVTLNDESLEGEEETNTKDHANVEIPITDEGEAYLFGLKQVGMAMRKSGHKVECKVIGNKRFEVGEWCRVHIPKFNEDSIMFISKVNHESSSDSEWITSLTLVDYPPSLGTGQSNSPQSSTESSEVTEQGLLNATNPNSEGGEGTSTEGENSG